MLGRTKNERRTRVGWTVNGQRAPAVIEGFSLVSVYGLITKRAIPALRYFGGPAVSNRAFPVIGRRLKLTQVLPLPSGNAGK